MTDKMTKTANHEIPDDMYKEQIMELYKSPSNFGTLKNPSHEKTAYNSICGDEVTVQLLVKNNVVQDVKFSGSGCVISVIAASMLTDKIKGLKVKDVKNLNAEQMLKMLNMKLNPARIKCALLALEAVKEALK